MIWLQLLLNLPKLDLTEDQNNWIYQFKNAFDKSNIDLSNPKHFFTQEAFDSVKSYLLDWQQMIDAVLHFDQVLDLICDDTKTTLKIEIKLQIIANLLPKDQTKLSQLQTNLEFGLLFVDDDKQKQLISEIHSAISLKLIGNIHFEENNNITKIQNLLSSYEKVKIQTEHMLSTLEKNYQYQFENKYPKFYAYLSNFSDNKTDNFLIKDALKRLKFDSDQTTLLTAKDDALTVELIYYKKIKHLYKKLLNPLNVTEFKNTLDKLNQILSFIFPNKTFNFNLFSNSILKEQKEDPTETPELHFIY